MRNNQQILTVLRKVLERHVSKGQRQKSSLANVRRRKLAALVVARLLGRRRGSRAGGRSPSEGELRGVARYPRLGAPSHGVPKKAHRRIAAGGTK